MDEQKVRQDAPIGAREPPGRASRVRGLSDPPRSLTASASALSVQGASCSVAAARCCIMAPVKPHDDVWKHFLERKGLSAVASVLEEYGLSPYCARPTVSLWLGLCDYVDRIDSKNRNR